MDRGYRCHAHVITAPFDTQWDAPVLRQPPFGNIEIGQNLDTTDHRRLVLARHAVYRLQQAIDTVTHLEPGFARIQVNIRHPPTDGLGKDTVDQFNDRCRLGLFLDIVQLFQLLPVILAILTSALVIHLAEVLVSVLNQPLEKLRVGQAQSYRRTQQPGALTDNRAQKRSRGQYLHTLSIVENWQQTVHTRKIARQASRQIGVNQ